MYVCHYTYMFSTVRAGHTKSPAAARQSPRVRAQCSPREACLSPRTGRLNPRRSPATAACQSPRARRTLTLSSNSPPREARRSPAASPQSPPVIQALDLGIPQPNFDVYDTDEDSENEPPLGESPIASDEENNFDESPPSRFMTNFGRDAELDCDLEDGWVIPDGPSSNVGPFTGFSACLLDPEKKKPEDFFDALFEERMYTIIAENTNIYATRKKNSEYILIFINLFYVFTGNILISFVSCFFHPVYSFHVIFTLL